MAGPLFALPEKMDHIIAAYIFSKLGRTLRPQLSEFFKVQKLLFEGTGLTDPSIQQHSPAWRYFLHTPAAEQIIEKLRQEISRGIEQGICFIYPGHADYPLEYNFIPDQPLFLSYLGQTIWKQSCNFAIVGSREPSRLSEIWCEQVLSEITQKFKLCLVSGGARGIDQIAHRIALRNGAPTLAFLPCGLNEIYPTSLNAMIPTILKSGGALLSEYLPNTAMQKHFFQQRNRLISGISFAVLVVEAKRKSGTLMTARISVEQHKPLFVLPSHPLDLNNQGGLELLLEGATPVTCAADLINYIQTELRIYYTNYLDIVGKSSTHH